jgi:16S rRNA (adenine(1408)-N(1))-methyltransferase
VDLGTGDGRFVLATAAADPTRLVVGVDPVASAMAEASRRAAESIRRGRGATALFVVASAEAIPEELCGIADLVTVNLPWGSLLRGALALDPTAAAGIARLLGPGGGAELLVAPAARDRLAREVVLEARVAGSLAADWRALGLELISARPATAQELASRRTTWARRLRLGAPGERGAWRLDLRKGTGTG